MATGTGSAATWTFEANGLALRRFFFWAVILAGTATANPAAPQQASLDLQEKCSNQAQKAFDHIEFQKRKMGAQKMGNQRFDHFINHYNVKLNRCLIQTIDTVYFNDDVYWTYRYVMDAYEGKIFGAYVWHSDKNKTLECKVTLPSGDAKICASSDEFDELIKIYME